MCVRVRVCVCASVRARVYVCVPLRVHTGIQIVPSMRVGAFDPNLLRADYPWVREYRLEVGRSLLHAAATHAVSVSPGR